MANSKEAIAIVLDVGSSMQGKANNLLQKSIHAISLIMQRKIFSESKDEICLILLGTATTKNALASDSEYLNITTEFELMPVSFRMLEFLKKYSPANDVVDADFIDAIVVAMDELIKKTEGRKSYKSKRLILFSCGFAKHNDDQLEDIIASFKSANIDLDIIGPDLSTDSTSLFKNEMEDEYKVKSKEQIDGENTMKKLIQSLDGTSFTLEEVIPYIQYMQKKQTKSTPWKAPLKISKNLEIPICLYSKVKAVKANSFKSVYAKNTDSEVITTRTYHLKDDEETEIDREDIIDGYRFGDILVPVSKEDRDAMKLKTEKSFKLLGFTKSENVRPEMYMGDTTWICVADPNNEAAGKMLSSLILACYEMNVVGIVRRVYAAHGQVKIGCLMPRIKADYHLFYYIELPFAEDVRHVRMPSLPINTTENQKNKPTDEQLNLIDELMNTMDLTQEVSDSKKFNPNKVFNPYLQRLYQCLEHRALNPFSNLPPPTQAILELTRIPDSISKNSQPILKKMEEAFVLENQVRTTQFKQNNIFSDTKDEITIEENCNDNQNNHDISNLHDFLKPQITEIGSVNALQDFLVLLTQSKDKKEVILMMGKKIQQFIADSFSNELFPKAFTCLESMRQQCIMHSLSNLYNQFLLDLRDELKNSGRLNFLKEFATSRGDLTLISHREDPMISEVKDEKSFINSLVEVVEPMVVDNQQIDEDNLIDELD